MDNSLLLLIGGLVLVGLLALLYTRFYKERDTGGTDELNWVNKSNYNIATSDAAAEAAQNATPAEAREMVHKMTDNENAIPPSEEVFYDLNDKTGGAGTSDEMKAALRDPDIKPQRA